MALGTPALATPTVFNAGASITTASFGTTAGALLIARAGTRAGVLMGDPTITDSAGLSWILGAAGIYDVGSGTRHKGRAWAAVATGAAMTVSTAATSGAHVALSVIQVTGQGGIPSNWAAKEDVNGDPTIVLPSGPAASSVVIALLTGAQTLATVTPPGSFVEIDDSTNTTGISSHVCYLTPSAPTSVAYVTNYNTCVGILVEVSAASSGASRVPLRPSRKFSHMMIR